LKTQSRLPRRHRSRPFRRHRASTGSYHGCTS
jgi:hypothetical protein